MNILPLIMRRLTPIFLIATFLLASAPSADAQLGRLLNRAREAVTDVRDEAETTVQRNARTGPAPALDFGSLLDTYILPDRSEIRFGSPRDYFLLFPNDGFDPYDVSGRYQLRDADGGVIWRSDIQGGGVTGTPAVAVLRGSGATAKIPSSGAYTIEVVYDGETVGALPFTADIQASGDPFDPEPATRIDGPWRTHAYFEHEVDRPDYIMTFNAWLRRDEPQGQGTTEVSIRRNGREVAWGSGMAGGTNDGWAGTEYRLYAPEGRDDRFGRQVANAPGWTSQDVTPGAYEIVLSTADGPFRTMSIQGGAGAFVPHPRSAIGTEPRTHYLTPRRMAGQNLSRAQQLDWVGPETL